jgi:hypothetical protein
VDGDSAAGFVEDSRRRSGLVRGFERFLRRSTFAKGATNGRLGVIPTLLKKCVSIRRMENVRA